MKRRISIATLIFLVLFSGIFQIQAQSNKGLLNDSIALKTEIEIDLNGKDVFKIDYISSENFTDVSIIGDKQTWIGATQELKYYELPRSEQWIIAYEYEVILKEKQDSNIFSFAIETDGLDYFYQPSLIDEYASNPLNPREAVSFVNDTHAFDENGKLIDNRPENVVGSFAVYDHSTGRKIMHIYRPKIVDANGNGIWGIMAYRNGVLTIEVNKEWLEKAIYPVSIDPTFGKTDKGGSNFFNQNNMNLFYVNVTEPMEIHNITIYLNKGSGSTNVTCSTWIKGQVQNYVWYMETDELLGWMGDGWITFNFSEPCYYTNRSSLSLGGVDPETVMILSWWASVNVRVYYDAGTYNQQWQRISWNYVNNAWDDSRAPDAWADRIISMYASYDPINTTIPICPPSPPIIKNVTGAWIEYNASAIGASVGTVDGGNLSSTFFVDGDTFNVSEVVGVPGMVVSVNFSGVDPDALSLWLVTYYEYDGNLNHDFDIEIWDFVASGWVEDSHLVDTVGFVWSNSTIYGLRIPLEYISGGEVRFRFDHEAAGNTNHDLFIDYVRLQAFVPFPATEEVFQFFWIVIGIALMLIGIMISKMWFDQENK